MSPTPQTPVGSHYSGEKGREYFAWQQHSGTAVGARIDVPYKYTPYLRPTDSVADFGCGNGEMLAPADVARRVGIEPNPEARAAAAERLDEAVASAEELPDAAFDVVVSNHALEHTLAPWHELREVRRILKPDGRLILWLPLDDWRRGDQHDPQGPDINHHLYTWTPRLLWNLLTEAGYTVDHVRVVPLAWPMFHEHLYRMLPRRVFYGLMRAWAVLRRQRQLMALASPTAGS
jgi:SAM-dependent methyltransferase